MAKRKRLSLPDLMTLPEVDAPVMPAPSASLARGSAPIAWVAGEASAVAALADLAGEMSAARDAGRMIQALDLDAVDDGYLMRDRMVADEAELEVLMQSLRARGQQVPIEVASLPDGRYGLISGWRRLSALRRLRAEVPGEPRFAKVLAILRRPEAASEAYLAMVEENEIRVGLSYYERARIVARAAEQGVFPDKATALSHLFAAASRAKRSKIGSFLRIVAALDDRLHFASAIPERLGLSLARMLDADEGFAARLRDRLRKTPAPSAEAELAVLERALTALKAPNSSAVLKPTSPKAQAQSPALSSVEIFPGIFVETCPGAITLYGPKVTADFRDQLMGKLRDWGDAFTKADVSAKSEREVRENDN